MLPSTGYFKGISCPFYDSGLCERPYCHFRHVKKELVPNASNDGIESGAILQKLVSAAVQKVLQQTESSLSATTTQQLTVQEADKDINVNNTQPKAKYNPTPIAELKKINTETGNNDTFTEQRKRHIPVPYTPRKPASLPITKTVEENGASKPFVFDLPPSKYTPGCTVSAQLDPYTPKGSTESPDVTDKYLPGTDKELQEYKPKETQSSSLHNNYVPSDRSSSKKKILEYKPTKVNKQNEKISVTYQPTPKSLVPCFSSDEDEPYSKKIKLTNDLNGLDDLGPEFDILDQILDEERLENDYTINDDEVCESIDTNEYPKGNHSDYSKKNEKSSRKHNDRNTIHKKDEKSYHKSDEKASHRSDEKSSHKSHEKSSHKTNDKSSHKNDVKSTGNSDVKKSDEKRKADKKVKSSIYNQRDKSSTDGDKKSHKGPSRDKNREQKKSLGREKKSSSKKPDKVSKTSKQSSSKSSDRHSKHFSSSSSASKSQNKEKSDHRHRGTKDKSSKHKDEQNRSKNLRDGCIDVDSETDYNDNGLLEMSESDEETIALECKRIFEEYVPTEKISNNLDEIQNSNQLLDSNASEYIPGKKRISRTSDKNIKVLSRPRLKPDYKLSAAQTMAERLVKVKEFHSSRSANTAFIETMVSKQESTKSTHINNSKIRIAHVPYASTMINAKKIITPIIKEKSDEPSTSSTVIQTVKRGTQRVAHIPNEKFIDRPGVLEPLASKIAANIRSTYLNMMIDECLKIYLSATDAYARAQHEELMTSKKCSTVQIYKNSAVLAVSRLRKEFLECNGVKKTGTDCSALQRIPQTVSGVTSNVGSWSIESKRTVNNLHEFTGAKFYKNILKWVLTEQQLQDNGFPRPHASGEKGRAIIYGQNKQTPPKGLIRTCCRCKKNYIVDKKGFPAIQEECIYHPNNKYRVRGEAKYQCCSQDSSSDGCCVAPSHVYEYVDFENLKGFIKTMPPDSEMDDYGVYSLDCEMCYTTHGLDLTRVTVINSACKVVFETLIKPLHPIIDYNTRYSGITEEQMANVKTTLLEVQATLLSMFNSKTILVGHSLESDFKALKLIHDTVIDTSVLFPHKMGPPFKRALRNLSSEYLKKIIQNSVDGHDSAEDATVCMELLIYKLKEDLKTR